MWHAKPRPLPGGRPQIASRSSPRQGRPPWGSSPRKPRLYLPSETSQNEPHDCQNQGASASLRFAPSAYVAIPTRFKSPGYRKMRDCRNSSSHILDMVGSNIIASIRHARASAFRSTDQDVGRTHPIRGIITDAAFSVPIANRPDWMMSELQHTDNTGRNGVDSSRSRRAGTDHTGK